MRAYEFEEQLTMLTEHQKKILEIIYLSGDQWLGRSEIAQAMHKRRLNPYDMECLNLLEERGLILSSKRPSRAPHIEYAHIYRVSETALHGITQWIGQR